MFCLCLAGAGWAPMAVHAYTPESPEVVKMIERGIQFLKSKDAGTTPSHAQGGEILKAYAVYKYEHNPEEPLVQRAVKLSTDLAAQSDRQFRSQHYGNYAVAVAILLLAEIDHVEYRDELIRLTSMLMSNQRAHGGIAYSTEQAGDISQTQYAMLAMWTMERKGLPVDERSIAKLVDFLLRVQDPSGGWGYFGIIGNRNSLVPQDKDMNRSLTMGAGGSLLMAGELFGFWSLEAATGHKGLPPAFRIADEREERRKRARSLGVIPEAILTAASRIPAYLANPRKDNNYRDYYRLYSEERYQSFLEIATGKMLKEPDWYNRGVEDLRKRVDAKGAWGVKDARKDQDEPGIATAFAVLYLMRSTQKAIEAASQGTARGGFGIPKDTKVIRMEGGQVKGEGVAGALEGMLSLIEGDGADELDGRSIPDDLRLSTEPAQRLKQLDRLERLVRGSQSYQARRVAARVLGESGELRVVPALIFALSDPDTTVQRFARDGLRFISRRFDGFGMPRKPNEQEMRAAQKAWKDWYLSLDPGYVFLDEDS